MKRGEIWSVSDDGDYTGKPRPAVILQNDGFDATSSITLCGFTTHSNDAPLLRLRIDPSNHNGLRAPSYIMVDKITTVRKNRIGKRIGKLEHGDMAGLDRAVATFLGLSVRTGAPSPEPE